MAEFRIQFDDDGAFERYSFDLSRSAAGAQVKALGVLRHHGMLLRARAMANASHPRSQDSAKPRIQTGDYVRSITLSVTGTSALVGTNRVQGRRLEFGFTGVDAIGRHYDQPPYPHFGPALDEVAPGFILGMAAIA